MVKTQTGASKQSIAEKQWRIYALAIVVFLIAMSIVGKLALLQIVRHGAYVALAENQHNSTSAIDSSRGGIFLRDGSGLYPLAVNRTFQMVFASPREMKDKDNETGVLSDILQLDKKELAQKLANPDDMFEILKHRLSEDEVSKIKKANLSGVYLEPENSRFYPSDALAAQVVGFVGSNGSQNRGMYGIEAGWENTLRGTDGTISQEGDSRGRWIPVTDRQVQPAQNGADLVLTIDHAVQFEVEKILKESLEQFDAQSGSIVVLEPKTGRILALANAPGFNPNDYSKTEDISLFSNPAVAEPYESGSVFKTFTEAIGIDTGKISPDTTYVDTGVVHEAGYEIRNSDLKANGVQTMSQVLENSLNTGVIYIEKLVGNKTFADYVRRFGFGEKTGIDLPGEVSGNAKNLDNPNRTINFYTASFGQGISVTPIQLAAGYGALANKGVLMKPQIVQSIINHGGDTEEIKPQPVRQVVSENTADLMGKMLRGVVTNGHGKRADVPGYLVGGKTGTAQVAKSGGGGYEEGMNIGSFAGYAPINDPQFVVVVKMYDPKKVEWAESSAAPTFGRVMKFLLEYNKVPPTEDPKTSPLAKMAPLALPSSADSVKPATEPAPVEEKAKDDKKKE